MTAPGRELREYRFNLDRARRRMVHESLEETVGKIDSLLHALQTSPDFSREAGCKVEAAEWQVLKKQVDALAMMLGNDLPRKSRWSDLQGCSEIWFAEFGKESLWIPSIFT